MKHESLLTDKDRSDLERAKILTSDGKALRRQVFARLRGRAHRRKTLT